MSRLVRVVGVRQLQQRLSAVLDLAESGEVVRVTSRGRPKAIILPPGVEGLVGVLEAELERARLEQGARDGWLRPRLVEELPEIPKRGFRGSSSSLEALQEDRGD